MNDKQREVLTQLVAYIAAGEADDVKISNGPAKVVFKKTEPVVESTDKSPMQSKKFRALLLGFALTVGSLFMAPAATRWGLPEAVLQDFLSTVATLGGAYLGAQGLTDAFTALKKKQNPE